MLSEIVRFNKWLRRKSPHAATHIHYTNDLKLFFTWVGKVPRDVTLHDIDAYIEHCQRIGHAIATVNRRLAAIRSFYHFLQVEMENAPPNPILPKRHFVRQGQRLPRDAEDADIEQLFSVIESSRDRAVFLLMLRCGLRVCEVHNLSLGDLYLQPTPGSLPRLWLHGKNESQRVVYLSPQTLTTMKTWLAVRPVVGDQAVFLSHLRCRLSIRGIQDRMTHYCRLAGVCITCHQLRHTFGRHLTEAGMPVTSLQKLLGHVRLRTTQLYTYISDAHVQADYEAAIVQVSQRLSLEGGGQ